MCNNTGPPSYFQVVISSEGETVAGERPEIQPKANKIQYKYIYKYKKNTNRNTTQGKQNVAADNLLKRPIAQLLYLVTQMSKTCWYLNKGIQHMVKCPIARW